MVKDSKLAGSQDLDEIQLEARSSCREILTQKG
jgi:hypothetical protein